MKLVILGLILFMAVGMGSRQPVPEPRPVPAPVEVPKPQVEYPTTTVGPMLVIGKCTNCTSEELSFIRKAERKMNEVVHGECFQKSLAGKPLIQTLGRDPSQVVASLIHADIHIDIEMYQSSKRVLGYTYPDVQMEWINRRYMLQWNVCDLGSLLSHETSHKVGYDHDYYATPNRNNSVPYASNFSFDACCLHERVEENIPL